MLSEVGYYARDPGLLADRAWGSLSADGVLVACHWRHPAPDHPHDAETVHRALSRPGRQIVSHVEDDFLLDVWTTTGRSVAVETGVTRMIDEIVVTVPAADEQDEIAACLGAVQRAVGYVQERTPLRARVVVALDDCRDRTAEIVAGFPAVQAVTCAARRVGTARRAAAAAALAGAGPLDRLWLVTTDADCRVPVDWLTAMAAAADSGADLVLGTVRPAGELAPGAERAWYDTHDLGDGHPHIHGAHLGIRANVYLRLGGWRDLVAHEDVDLVERAVAEGVSIVRSAAAPVATSTRLVGRAPDGFAAYLRLLRGDPPDLAGGLPAVS